jgi:hypothetical protein
MTDRPTEQGSEQDDVDLPVARESESFRRDLAAIAGTHR